jgi:hypothetical protein
VRASQTGPVREPVLVATGVGKVRLFSLHLLCLVRLCVRPLFELVLMIFERIFSREESGHAQCPCYMGGRSAFFSFAQFVCLFLNMIIVQLLLWGFQQGSSNGSIDTLELCVKLT